MKILIIDNYDSFTFNLYQIVGELLYESGKLYTLDVIKNDELSLEEIKARKYNKILISPGPGDSADEVYFGVCSQVILELGKTISVLGVCLGMQGICHYFGGKVVRANTPMHGKTSIVVHNNKNIFKNLPQKIEAMRYHSLVASPDSIPDCLEITCLVGTNFKKVLNSKNYEIMGLKHKKYPIEGVQFHPESFASEAGNLIIKNWLEI
jgi:anthranilate synthase component 2